MPVISSGGRWLTDAKQMLSWAAPSANVLINTVASNVAGFWGSGRLNEFAFASDAYSSDTYKTLLNVSGKGGYLYSVIGPEMVNATDTTTFRLTIDGIATTKAITGSGTSLRCGLGTVSHSQSTPAASTDAYTASASRLIGPNSMYVPTPAQIHFFGGDRIRFENSMKVEVKITNAQSTATNYERYSGCIYLTDS